MRIPVGFGGTLIDTWNGWAVFTCTRQAADATVAGQWVGATGLAFAAAVTLDGVPVATIHDHGDGTGIHLDADGSGWAGMAEYLAGCRLYGAPVDLRRLLVALIDEHYLSGATAQAN